MRKTPQPVALLAVIAMIAALVAVAFSSPAHAHTALVSSTPVDGETLAVLDEVRLEFTDALLEIGSELVITGAADPIALEPFFPEPGVIAAPVPPLGSGDYSLAWRVVAEDGHPIESVIAFTIDAPVPSPSPTPTPSASPSPSAVTIAAPMPTASPTPGITGEVSTMVSPWVLGVVALAVVAGVVVAIVAARARSGGASGDQGSGDS